MQAVASDISATESLQLKRKAKGKGTVYDPNRPKKLTVFVALKYPGWQEKYIDIVREAFDSVSLTTNDKVISSKVPKSEMKKAMPFIQVLKRRLTTEKPDNVFERKLAFDEVDTLKQIMPALQKNAGCTKVDMVLVDEGGKTGTKDGVKVEDLPPMAEGAEPGRPKYEFANVE